MSGNSRISPFKRQTARRLRQSSTEAEALLWRQLKHLDIRGSHFRRQMPIGNYIVDFACAAAHLMIEVDGSQHGTDTGRFSDADRTRWLNAEGYRVIRLWNSDILRDIDAAMELIYSELYGARNAETTALKHQRRRSPSAGDHPTPARKARRPSPSRGG